MLIALLFGRTRSQVSTLSGTKRTVGEIEGRKEGRKEGGKEGRREGRKEGREGRKEGREGRKEGRKEGKQVGRKAAGGQSGLFIRRVFHRTTTKKKGKPLSAHWNLRHAIEREE